MGDEKIQKALQELIVDMNELLGFTKQLVMDQESNVGNIIDILQNPSPGILSDHSRSPQFCKWLKTQMLNQYLRCKMQSNIGE